MKIVHPIARVLLGLIFLVLGLNGFLGFLKAPPIPGPAGDFLVVMMVSHFVWFVSGVQVICGILLIINRYVPLAIVTLAAVLANVLAYHLTMALPAIPLALLTTAIWFVVAWPLRAQFAPLFVSTVDIRRSV